MTGMPITSILLRLSEVDIGPGTHFLAGRVNSFTSGQGAEFALPSERKWAASTRPGLLFVFVAWSLFPGRLADPLLTLSRFCREGPWPDFGNPGEERIHPSYSRTGPPCSARSPSLFHLILYPCSCKVSNTCSTRR